MYGWFWRALPGPWWLRLFFVLALLAAVVWFCFQFFFPWVSPRLPFNQDTIEGDYVPASSQQVDQPGESSGPVDASTEPAN